MKKTLSFVLCALLLLGMFSGCQSQNVQSGDQITLNVYNWGQYISDGSDGCLDVIAAFEEAYPHIKVNYSTYDSNEVMYTKLIGGGITVDVIIPS
ncbi:MAG: spermidine/putrescine ABC transporter substrate-binding protein, partial [Oscillospiraceae bacterium]|nr:spermidine/putrescine ABC transporter substrate-binding protein [Oscillospiraceae bacterium]